MKDLSAGYSSIEDVLGALIDKRSNPFPNKEVEKIRKSANQELQAAGVNRISNLFLEKQKKSPLSYPNLFFPTMPNIQILDSLRDDDSEKTGKRILGKIKIRNEEITSWVNTETADKGIIFSDLFTAAKRNSEEVTKVFSNNMITKENIISNVASGNNVHNSLLFIPEGIPSDGIFVIEIEISHINSFIPIHLISCIGGSANADILIHIKSYSDVENRSVGIIQNDVMLGENSHLNIIQNQKIGRKVALFCSTKFQCLNNSILNSFILDQGGAITNRNVDTNMVGKGSSAIITGLYISNNGQRFYYDTQQNHSAPNSSSDLLFKGVIGKNAYSSWKGNIFVSKDSIGTNGYQANANLLIDHSAKAESIPGLEILTDDVRCSHGVTIGNINRNQMFYLQSRGIEKKEAERMIIEGYFRSTLKRIPDLQLREYIQKSIEI